MVTHNIEETIFLGQKIAVFSDNSGKIRHIADNSHSGEISYFVTEYSALCQNFTYNSNNQHDSHRQEITPNQGTKDFSFEWLKIHDDNKFLHKRAKQEFWKSPPHPIAQVRNYN